MRRWLPTLSSLVLVLAFSGCAKLAWFTGQTISFCDVRDDPNTYADERVRLTALIQYNNDKISAFSLCSRESWPRATVSLAPEQSSWLTENKLVRGNGADKLYLADVVIV